MFLPQYKRPSFTPIQNNRQNYLSMHLQLFFPWKKSRMAFYTILNYSRNTLPSTHIKFARFYHKYIVEMQGTSVHVSDCLIFAEIRTSVSNPATRLSFSKRNKLGLNICIIILDEALSQTSSFSGNKYFAKGKKSDFYERIDMCAVWFSILRCLCENCMK